MYSGRGGQRPGAGAPVKAEEDKVKSKQVRISEPVIALIEKEIAKSGKKSSVRSWIEQAVMDRLQTKGVE